MPIDVIPHPGDLLAYLFPAPDPALQQAIQQARVVLQNDPPVAVDYSGGGLALRLQSGQSVPLVVLTEAEYLPGNTPAVSLNTSQHPGGAGRTAPTMSFGVTGRTQADGRAC